MNKNPYIPNGSTPIKNTIIFNIISRGLLSYAEIRIVMYVIYESWRYVDQENQRRQDWTYPLTVAQISKAIGMPYAEVHRHMKNMTKSHILLVKDGNRYQFNEHFEQYDKKSYMTKNHTNMTKSHTDMTKSHIQQPSNPDENKADSSLNKTINKTINKRTTSKKLKIIFNSETELFENITEIKIQKWTLAYPGIDIKQSIKQMEIWLAANPEKRPTKNYERFIVNWLGSDFKKLKGGKDGRNQKYIPISRKDSDDHQDRDIPAGEW